MNNQSTPIAANSSHTDNFSKVIGQVHNRQKFLPQTEIRLFGTSQEKAALKDYMSIPSVRKSVAAFYEDLKRCEFSEEMATKFLSDTVHAKQLLLDANIKDPESLKFSLQVLDQNKEQNITEPQLSLFLANPMLDMRQEAIPLRTFEDGKSLRQEIDTNLVQKFCLFIPAPQAKAFSQYLSLPPNEKLPKEISLAELDNRFTTALEALKSQNANTETENLHSQATINLITLHDPEETQIAKAAGNLISTTKELEQDPQDPWENILGQQKTNT